MNPFIIIIIIILLYDRKTKFYQINVRYFRLHIELIPPSYIDPEDDGAKPDQMLKCDWVYPLLPCYIYQTVCLEDNTMRSTMKLRFLRPMMLSYAKRSG